MDVNTGEQLQNTIKEKLSQASTINNNTQVAQAKPNDDTIDINILKQNTGTQVNWCG